jgi:signal transduction histidine kinase
VVANVVAILTLPDWATVPFHFIWITLSLLYGWRIWGLRTTAAALTVVIALTGIALLVDVVRGSQAPDELTEVPLMAIVFVVMVIYVRRSVAAREDFRQVSERNLALLQEQQRLVQDASHVIRTPLTNALGYAELIKKTTADPEAARDSEVVIEELNRLKTVSDRLLRLAAAQQPDFVRVVETSIRDLVMDVYSRWSKTCPALELGQVADVSVPLDPPCFLDALDELIGNAVAHTPAGTPVRLSARCEDGCVVVAVADKGPGIPRPDKAQIFGRFVRTNDSHHNGLGLGLAIVKRIAEAHGGSVALKSEPGHGAIFELRLPLAGGSTAGQLFEPQMVRT